MLRDEDKFLNKVAGKLSAPVAFRTSNELHTFQFEILIHQNLQLFTGNYLIRLSKQLGCL